MKFLPNILNTDFTTWSVVGGSATNSTLLLNEAGYAYCSISLSKLGAIPEALSLNTVSTNDGSWKSPETYAFIHGIYADGSYLNAVSPVSMHHAEGSNFVTWDLVLLTPGKHATLIFKIKNVSGAPVTYSTIALKPSDTVEVTAETVLPANTNYTTAMARNIKVVPLASAPVAGAAATEPNGSIIFVKAV